MTEEQLGQLLKERGWLSPGEKETIAKAWEVFSEYAGGYIGFQKLRSGQVGLTPEEERIKPLLMEARELLGINKKKEG